MQTDRINNPRTALPCEAGLTVAGRIRALHQLAADERVNIRAKLAAEGELLRLRISAQREVERRAKIHLRLF